MALRNIVQIGDETLRKKSFPVIEFNEKLWNLLDDMRETLIKENGAGLAAPQVGVLRRAFIVMVNDDYYECVNPTIIKKSGVQVGEEGCLSVKGRYGTVSRPKEVLIKAFDRFGKPIKIKAEGFTARAFCHEYDHLEGILYVDIAEKMSEEES